jgi:predicted XRE-type DNA-binding protein
MSTADDIRVIEGTGNVFADLEVADAEEALIKAELARAISAIISGKHLAQMQAAEVLCIDQPKVSALMRGRLSGFSVDRLLRFLVALDRDVEIVIAPKKQQQPHTRVTVVTGS